MRESILCIVPTVFLLAIFGTAVAMRWFKHREIMAMVEKGMLPDQYAQYTDAPRRRNGRGLMGWGVVMAMVGLACGPWALCGWEEGIHIRSTLAPGCCLVCCHSLSSWRC